MNVSAKKSLGEGEFDEGGHRKQKQIITEVIPVSSREEVMEEDFTQL